MSKFLYDLSYPARTVYNSHQNTPLCAVSRLHRDIQRDTSRWFIYYIYIYNIRLNECVFIMNKISWIHQSSGDCGFTMSEENFYCTTILNVIFFYFVGGNQPVSAQWPAVWNAYKWTCAVTVQILQFIRIGRYIYNPIAVCPVASQRYLIQTTIAPHFVDYMCVYFSSRKLDIHYILYVRNRTVRQLDRWAFIFLRAQWTDFRLDRNIDHIETLVKKIFKKRKTNIHLHCSTTIERIHTLVC